jgi:hypothetical protein
MIFNANSAEDFRRTDDLCQFLSFVWAVETRGNEDQDVFPGDPGPDEALDEGREDQPIRDRPGDVANEDAGAPFPLSQFLKGRACHGFFQSVANGSGRVWKQRHGMLPDHVGTNSLRQINRQPLSSV